MVIASVASLTYLVQLQDSRIWRKHVDHVVVTENQVENTSTRTKQQYYGKSCEAWSYRIDTQSYSLPSNNHKNRVRADTVIQLGHIDHLRDSQNRLICNK